MAMENGRVVKLSLEGFGLTGAVPAEVGRLTALREFNVSRNALTLLPAEIGQLASLESLELGYNELTSVPEEIGQLTSLEELHLNNNKLTSVPAEIGQLASLTGVVASRQSADERAGGDRAAHIAEERICECGDLAVAEGAVA